MSVFIVKDSNRIDALFKSLEIATEKSLFIGIASQRNKRPAPKKAVKTKKGKKPKVKVSPKETAAAEVQKPKAPPITNSEIAYMNEFGTATIPARPFLIPSIEQAEDKIKACLDLQLNPNTGAMEFTEASMNVAGLLAQNEVRQYIVKQIGFKPLSPKTISARRRKRKSGLAGTKALIDTGSLLNSIGYVIDKGK